MKPFSLIENKYTDSSDHLRPPTFDTEFETCKFGTYSFGGYSIGKPSPVKNFEIDELFRSEEKVPQLTSEHPVSDASTGQVQDESKKVRRSHHARKKKQGQMFIKLEEGDNDLNFKLNRNDENSHCHKAKTRSDVQTESTLSPHEFYGLNGLAGSTAYFKRSKCSACRLIRLVFWFGNPSNNNKADRFLCVECVKIVTGEQKFVSIVASEHSWSFPLEKEVMASRRSTASKDTKKLD